MKHRSFIALMLLIFSAMGVIAQRKTIIPDKTTFDFKAGHFLFETYTSEAAYKRNLPSESSYNEKSLLSNNEHMEGILQRVLKKENLIDTSKSIFPDSKNSLKLDMAVTRLETQMIQTVYQFRVLINYKFTLSIKSHYGKTLHTDKFSDNFEFVIFYYDDDAGTEFTDRFENEVKERILDFLESDEVKALLEIDKILDPPFELNADSVTIATQPVKNIADWNKALVTVMDSLGHGSGAIISSDGYIVSNYHVVATSEQLHVKLHNDRSFPATVVRYDPETDLALLKIDTTHLHTFEIYSSTENLIGEEIFVAGTPIDTLLTHTISYGIVSGKRGYHGVDYLQTDAVVNFGNSGGPMLTTDGRIAGIVNAKFGGFGIEGIGFAIPLEYLHERLKLKRPIAAQTPHVAPVKKTSKK